MYLDIGLCLMREAMLQEVDDNVPEMNPAGDYRFADYNTEETEEEHSSDEDQVA